MMSKIGACETGSPALTIKVRFTVSLGHSPDPFANPEDGFADSKNHHSDTAYDHDDQKHRSQIDGQGHLNQSAHSMRFDRFLSQHPSHSWDCLQFVGG